MFDRYPTPDEKVTDGYPVVASVGTTPAAVLPTASVAAPGLPATSCMENHRLATVVRAAVLLYGISCFALAIHWSNVDMLTIVLP
jgi:hypothetical protein